jgi:hypothetical protein
VFWGAAGTPCITDCVMAELEKLGQKYRVALRYVHFQWICGSIAWCIQQILWNAEVV